MAGTIIRIKHSDSNNAPANDDLAKSELAYSFNSHNLFVGEETGGEIVARPIGAYPAGATTATIVDADTFTFYDDTDNRFKKALASALKTYVTASLNLTLSTDTTGDFVGTITAGEGIASSGATSGEDIDHSISLKNAGNLTDTYIPRWDNGNTQLTNGSLFDDGAGTVTIRSDDTPAAATIRSNGDLILDPTPFDSPYTDSSPEAGGTVYIAGSLIVNGSTTTVNSNVVNIGDSTIVLNSDEAGTPSQDGGIEIERGTSTNKTLIWDESEDEWTVGSETFIAGAFEGNLTGAVTGNADTATVGTSVTVTANNSADETTYITFVDGTTGTQGIESDTGLTYNPSSNTVTASIFAGTLSTAAQTNITSLGTLTALTVDDVAINGGVVTMTGSSGDTAVLTAGTNGTLSIVTNDATAAAANIQITADGTVDIDSAGVLTLDSGAAINIEPATGSAILLDGTISVDAGVVTGATSITSTAFVGGLTGNVTGNTSGTAATVTTAAQSNITSLGTLTSLTVDDVAVDGKVITMTGSASDTAVLTAGTNGTLSIVTTDAAAAAANIQITADGTVDIDSAGVLTLDSGAAINIEPASGSAILLDGTISVDAGVVTGATSITSTAFVGDITGDVTGNADTADTATVGTNVTVTANNSANETTYIAFVDGATGTQGIESDTGLTYNPSTNTVTASSFAGAFSGAVTGNADTATVGTSVTVSANNSTDETTYITFVDGTTGTQGIESDTGLTYNPSTNTVTATIFSGRAAHINAGASNQLVYQSAANTTAFVATTDSAGDSPGENLNGAVLSQLANSAPVWSTVIDGGTF